MTNTPIVNLGNPYLQGLKVQWVGNRAIQVTSGYARDFTNTNDMVVSSTISVDLDTIGAGGIESTIANNTTYVVTLIGDSTKFNSPSVVVGLPGSGGLPDGYDIYRRVGALRTDGSANVLKFYQYGWGLERWMWYDVGISVLNAGTSTTFAAVSLASAVPGYTTGTQVKLRALWNADSAGDIFHLRPTGSTASDGIVQVSNVSAAENQVLDLDCPCLLSSSNSSIDYKVAASGALTLSVIGYLDSLPVLTHV